MNRRWVVAGAALACLVIVPFLFESYTFHLYDTKDPLFFTFSGARLWVFLVVEIAFGLLIGFVARNRPLVLAGLAAAAITMLIILLYHLCDSRQCYYAGPDGFAEARLGLLCFAEAIAGIMIGRLNSRQTTTLNSVDVLLFGTITAILLGYHPWALLFATYLPSSLATAVLVWSAVLPFVISGIVTRLLSNQLAYSVCSAIAGSAALALMFAILRPSSSLLLPLLLVSAITSSVAGFVLLKPAALRPRMLQ